MRWSKDFKDKLNISLNEATWRAMQVNERAGAVALVFSVLTLPEEGPEPENPTVTLVLKPVGRIAASFRNGAWNDENATVEPLTLDELPGVVESFGGVPIYGWEFVDPSEKDWEEWRSRLSLDVQWRAEAQTHVIEILQEGVDPSNLRHLDLRVWFSDLQVFDAAGVQVDTEQFAEGGKRWWDAFYEYDPRTEGHGMAPLSPTPQVEPRMRLLSRWRRRILPKRSK